MKVIVAGSRFDERHPPTVAKWSQAAMSAMDDFTLAYEVTEIVSGTARGADRCGEQWAADRGVKVSRFPADWDALGKRAGYVRNEAMAKYADALVALWDGESRGTKHMIDLAEKHGLVVLVRIVK